MEFANDPSPDHDRRPSGRHGVTTELRRAAWIAGGGLATIALTVLGVTLIVGRSGNASRLPWLATIAVCCEVFVVLLAMSWLSRQIDAHAATMEKQREQLERQAETLAAQTREVAAANELLVDAAADAHEARKRAEGEARQKARVVALLNAALGSAPVGFAFFDRDLRFLRVNATLAAIIGRAAEDHVGATLHEVHPWMARQVEPILRDVLTTRTPVTNAEFVGVASGRSPGHTWLTSCFPIITADDELFGVGMAVTDVTEVKRLEAQFLQAQKMEAVGRLAGGVAHDFNNLLTVISSYAELILYDPAMEKARDEIQEIRGAAARAAKLTRQLLAFSRRQAMEPRIVNPNDVIRGVEHLLRGLIIGNVEIATHLAPETPLIRVDPGQLEQVVMNLAINAADAMSEGGRLGIETMTRVLDGPYPEGEADFVTGTYALIRVSDSGHGMSEETRRQIFEPFFTTKEPGRGTGLGLSTAYGIVKQSGGHIDVESKEGAGSVFSVYLPAVTSAELAG